MKLPGKAGVYVVVQFYFWFNFFQTSLFFSNWFIFFKLVSFFSQPVYFFKTVILIEDIKQDHYLGLRTDVTLKNPKQ